MASSESRGSHNHQGTTHSLLEGLDVRKPLLQNVVYKETTIHGTFNERYFVLYPKVMVYYKKKSDFQKDFHRNTFENRLGAISLKDVYLTKPEKKPQGGRHCFVMHAPHAVNKRHTYLLVNKTREERRDWMNKIQEQNPNLLSVEHHYVHPDSPQPPRTHFLGDSGDLIVQDGSSDIED